MEREQVLRELREAVRRRQAAENERSEAIDQLAASVRMARDAGVSISEIARECSISRQAVHKLLRRA